MSLTRWCLRTLAPLTAAALVVTTATAGNAAVIWAGTALPGTGTCPDGSIAWQNDSQHGNVFRFRVNDKTGQNSERCEMAVARRLLNDGQTVYIGWKSRVSAPTTNTWNYILQLKCHGTNVANHPLTLGVGGGRLTLRNDEDVNGVQVGRTVWSTPLTQGQWFSMVLKVRYSENRSVGQVQVWYNGRLQTLAGGGTTHYGQTWDGTENNVHWGIYRRSSVNGTQIHDLYRPRIATTMAEVNPG
ncbi:heparin lyase I family protein [Nonomuraea sp. NPDC050790]|uniref:heparin lyase I family protein n=1 Tax=Nonomuraea sp. NPDC050790 TaxID=3364371 RepID=UPI0037BAA401